MQLLDMLLSLMNEEELRRDDDPTIRLVELLGSGFLLIGFHGQIPDRDRVVSRGSGENRCIGRMPFNRGDRLLVPSEVGDWSGLRHSRRRYT